ncbi:MAG TPA: ribosome rescue protein RqcH [Thermoplasmata archaeon]|nr:ribosome rescue protein RqcH [Thermoplasmata archaeon]
MKDALTSFDLRALVAEWQPLVGGYVDKVYQERDEVILRLNVPGAGRRELYCKAGKWLVLLETEEKPETPPAFAMALRRSLGNARLEAIEQRGFDRVAVFTFQKESAFQLVFEMFGKGNVILVSGGNTVAAMRTQSFRARTIKAGIAYDFPPPGTNPLDLDRDGFRAAVRAARGPVVKVLAAVLNLGGTYAEELCLRGGVAKDATAKDLADADLDALFTALNNVAVAVDQEQRPAVVLRDGKAVDAAPIDLALHAGLERREHPTFNEALAAFLAMAPAAATAEEDATAGLRHRIAQLQENVESLRREAMDAEAKALFLYAHFPLLDELLRAVREGRAPEDVQVKGIDPEKGTVTVAIGDFDALVLDYRADVTRNAQALYDARREAQRKAERVLEAIRAAEDEVRTATKKAVKAAKRPKVAPTKRFWFEAYRWCLSSEGFLILGGRDAKANDSLVRKHLKDGDRYAHADIHGAPSVVVKDGSKAGDATLREACELALVYSKAWPAGLSGGSAFWVLPEQVSKQAESGEYLGRGAFVVRGKRNYVHDVPVTMAVGEVEVEGQRKVMAGPVSAVSARATRLVVLVPGEMDRDRLVGRLAGAFTVPEDEVGRLLPPGGFGVHRVQGLELGLDAPRAGPPA